MRYLYGLMVQGQFIAKGTILTNSEVTKNQQLNLVRQAGCTPFFNRETLSFYYYSFFYSRLAQLNAACTILFTHVFFQLFKYRAKANSLALLSSTTYYNKVLYKGIYNTPYTYFYS